jgi:outer membrane protein TolC
MKSIRWVFGVGLFMPVLFIAGCSLPIERQMRSDYRAEILLIRDDSLPAIVSPRTGKPVADHHRTERAKPLPWRSASDVSGIQTAANALNPAISEPQNETSGDPNESATLDECIHYAARRNPNLQAAFYRWKAALEKIPQARALPDPKLWYEALTQVETPEHRFGFKQEFPQPGMLRAEGDIATREALARQHMFEAEKLRLFYEVKSVFHECEYLVRAIVAEQESIRLTRDIEGVLRSRYAAAAADHPSLLRLQAELAKMETELAGMEAMRPVLSARLNEALGRGPQASAVWPSLRTVTEELTALDERELLDALAADSPELRAAREMVNAAEAGRRKAKAGYRPMFMIGVRQMRMEGGPPMEERDYPVEAMLEMTLPFNYAKNNAALREAEAKMAEAEKEQEALANKLSTELKEAYYYYQDANRRLVLARETLLPKQEEALKSLQKSFAGGQAEFMDVVEAQRTLLAFRVMAERARADRLIRLSELEMMAAQNLRKHSDTISRGEEK